MEYAIRLNNITKHYDDFCLDHVSLAVPQGCIVGLVGENGAGKTTVLRAILQMMSLDEGTIEVLGQERDSADGQWKEEVGVVLTVNDYFASLNAVQVEKIMSRLYRNWDRDAWSACLDRFAISPKKKIGKYSRGMRVKLNLAIALSHRARLLLLDEATSGLDPMIRDEILDILREFILEEDHTVLLSTHIISDLEKSADYVACLHRGHLQCFEEKDALLYRYGITRCTEKEYRDIPGKYVAGVRRDPFGCEVLIRDRTEAEKTCGWLRTERASLEEILVGQMKGVAV